jgi:hypothetical protein
VLDVKNCLNFIFWSFETLVSWQVIHLYTYEHQEIQIKNPFDPILGIGLVTNF